jgi:hypothetical protein
VAGGIGAVLLATSVVGVPAAGRPPSPRPPAEPGIEVPAPWFWDGDAGVRAGADADRFELDALPAATDLSDWYHLAYVDGGNRLRVRDHIPPTTTAADAAIGRSENVAWHVATHLLTGGGGMAGAAELPEWARPRTGTTDGTSAGLVFALADLDLVTPGRLGGDLRIAGTGALGSDGAVTAVRMVDAKFAAARAAGADVFFTPERPAEAPDVFFAPERPAAAPDVFFTPPSPAGAPDVLSTPERPAAAAGSATAIASHVGRPAADRTIGDWLATAAYEASGRAAASGTASSAPAVVVIDDVRQAVAWLCGRTQLAATCALAHTAAGVLLAAARPLAGAGRAPSAAPGRPR